MKPKKLDYGDVRSIMTNVVQMLSQADHKDEAEALMYFTHLIGLRIDSKSFVDLELFADNIDSYEMFVNKLNTFIHDEITLTEINNKSIRITTLRPLR
jgi:hypothetical protein